MSVEKLGLVQYDLHFRSASEMFRAGPSLYYDTGLGAHPLSSRPISHSGLFNAAYLRFCMCGKGIVVFHINPFSFFDPTQYCRVCLAFVCHHDADDALGPPVLVELS